MSRIIFTEEQVEELLKNKNVVRCSRAIVYSKDFKIRAVKLYNEQGLSPQGIFRQAGFDLNIIGRRKPKGLIRDWNKVYRMKGEAGLKIETRGRARGRPKTKNLTDTEKLKYLETQVAYLKAENAFLAKLRVKRAESNSGRAKNTNSSEN